MERQLPKQTGEIFTILSRNNFISSNGAHWRLYDLIREEGNFQLLKEYFSHINFTLEAGNNYFYFSLPQEQALAIEKKLEVFANYIDVLDFFSCLDVKPVPGTRYRPTKVAEECFSNERLKSKINVLSRKEKLSDKVYEVCDMLANNGFFEKEDEETYKVLDAIHYLEQIISFITIQEDGQKNS